VSVPESEVWTTDLAVIGGGAGAWTAMRVARAHGKQVVLFEDQHLGGTCVNVGCIPTKAMVRSAEVVDTIRSATRYGVAVEGFRVDYHAVMARVNGIVQTSRSFYERAIASDPGVLWVPKTVRFTSPTRLEWDGGAVESDRIIIASGTESWWPEIPGLKECGVDSEGILELDALPDRLVIEGGGVIGVEFAQIFARLGSKVTIVARGPRILSAVDPDATAVIERALRRDGVRLMHNTNIRHARRHLGGWHEVDVERIDGEKETVLADAILVATGRRPKVSGLDLEAAGIELDPVTHGPKVDDELRTTSPHTWALGDAIGRQLYTHVANHEGPMAAKNALLDAHIVPDFYDQVPGAVFCDPELAVVGLRPDEAEARGLDAVTGTYPMTRNGKARAIGRDEGFIRMTVERGSKRILGATLVCHDAANALQEILVAMAGDGTITPIRTAIHTHPTIVEAVNACARELEARL
jgi:pyruvate/2-oxoglutarate dehydrogenase complex dihydrolipoamide dehydrogenase (E3) component